MNPAPSSPIASVLSPPFAVISRVLAVAARTIVFTRRCLAPARFAGFAGLAACALLASCAIEVTEPCPAGAQPALAVSPTGADGRLCAATVLVEEVEGSYSETLVPDDGCVHKGALDRPGLYKVVVSAPGYRTQTLWPDASDTQCGHSKTFAVTVTMAPELSLP